MMYFLRPKMNQLKLNFQMKYFYYQDQLIAKPEHSKTACFNFYSNTSLLKYFGKSNLFEQV